MSELANPGARPVADDWKPTAENISALPAPLRRYIYALTSDADPAGTIRQNVLLKDENAALRRMVAILSIPQRLYDSKINFALLCFWDCGFVVKLGDELNGFKAEGEARPYGELLEWLDAQARRHFPHSHYAADPLLT